MPFEYYLEEFYDPIEIFESCKFTFNYFTMKSVNFYTDENMILTSQK
jgi:hypothetical protein